MGKTFHRTKETVYWTDRIRETIKKKIKVNSIKTEEKRQKSKRLDNA